MSWTQEVENYGKCIVLNENTELEPVKCDLNHNTICSVNISWRFGSFDGMQDTGNEKRSTGKVSQFNIHLHDVIA